MQKPQKSREDDIYASGSVIQGTSFPVACLQPCASYIAVRMNVPVAKGKTGRYKYDSPVHSPVQSGPLTSRLSWTTRCTGRSCTSFPPGGCRLSQKTPCSPDTPSGRSRPTLRHCVRVGGKTSSRDKHRWTGVKVGAHLHRRCGHEVRANLEFASAPSLPGAAFIFGETSRFRQRKRALLVTRVYWLARTTADTRARVRGETGGGGVKVLVSWTYAPLSSIPAAVAMVGSQSVTCMRPLYSVPLRSSGMWLSE